MVTLSTRYQSKARFHLVGTGAGIPAGDLARIEEAFATIPDDTIRTYIEDLIDRCDDAWNDIKTLDTSQTVQAESYAGDINRTIVRAQKNLQVFQYYYKIYYTNVEELARSLWVPEYRTPNGDHLRFARSGGEYINSVPGAQGDRGDPLWTAMMFA